jgi:Trypsin
MRARFNVALVAALAAVVLAALPAMAITKNYQRDFDHPFVGLIVFYDQEGEFSHRCSGSLIDSTTFITAGHCTDDEAGGVMSSARIWFNQSGGKDYDPATELDPNSGYPEACYMPATCRTSHEMYNYGFNDFAGFPNTRDVGVVILDSPYDPGEFAFLPAAGYLNAKLKGTKDVSFRASGYGLSYSSPVRALSFRERLMADGKLVNTSSANNRGFNLQLQGNGKGRGATCSGDSGGPIFHPPTSNRMVAVTSFGLNAYCRGVDFAYRLDRSDVLSWIDSVSD